MCHAVLMLLFYCTKFGEVAIPVLFIDPIICPDWEVSQWWTGVAVEQRGPYEFPGRDVTLRAVECEARILSQMSSVYTHIACFVRFIDSMLTVSVPNDWWFASLCEIWGFKSCDVYRLTHRRPVCISVALTRMVTSPQLSSCHRIPFYWLFIDWEQVDMNFAVHTTHHQMH